jgi:hypothetical protein
VPIKALAAVVIFYRSQRTASRTANHADFEATVITAPGGSMTFGTKEIELKSIAPPGSAAELAEDMKNIALENPESRIVCIAHSHGGNVALHAIEQLNGIDSRLGRARIYPPGQDRTANRDLEIAKMVELGIENPTKRATLDEQEARSVKVVAGVGFEPTTFRL